MTPGRAWLIAKRELFAERRHPDGIAAALTFTGIVVFLESIALGPGRARQPDVASAIFWIAIAFAAILVVTRSLDRELEDDAIDAVLALDGGREALYGGKVLALAAILAIVAIGAGLLSIFLLDLDVALPWHLVGIAFLGVAALPPVIVLTSLLALRVRARVAIVPILTLPLLVPQLIAGTQATSSALTGDAAAVAGWAGLLAASALVYGVLGLTVAPGAIE